MTTQAGVSATTPALTLYNPINSPVNLVLWQGTYAFQAAPAAASAIILAANLPTLASVPTGPTSTTLASIWNNLLGTGVGAAQITGGPWGQCYRVATLSAAPIAIRYPFGTTGAAAIGGASFTDFVDGLLVIGPGVAVSVQTSSAASLCCSFTWEEVPIG